MSDPPRWRRALAAQPVEWLSDRVARTGLRSAGCPRAVVEAQALPPAPGAGVADDDFGLRMLHCAVTQQARQQCVQVVRPCKAGNNKRDARPHAWRHAFLPIPIAGVRTRFTHTSAQIPPVAVLVGPVAGQRDVHVYSVRGGRVLGGRVLSSLVAMQRPTSLPVRVRQARSSSSRKRSCRFCGARS